MLGSVPEPLAATMKTNTIGYQRLKNTSVLEAAFLCAVERSALKVCQGHKGSVAVLHPFCHHLLTQLDFPHKITRRCKLHPLSVQCL